MHQCTLSVVCGVSESVTLPTLYVTSRSLADKVVAHAVQKSARL